MKRSHVFNGLLTDIAQVNFYMPQPVDPSTWSPALRHFADVSRSSHLLRRMANRSDTQDLPEHQRLTPVIEPSEAEKLSRRLAEQMAQNQDLRHLLSEMKSIRSEEVKTRAQEIARLKSLVAEVQSKVLDGRATVCH